MEKISLDFENNIFKNVFSKKENYDKLVIFVGDLLEKKINELQILDSSYIEENDEIFALHLLMDVDHQVVWFIFAFGDERDYLREEYYYQTNNGIKLNDTPPVIRYNMNKICMSFDEENEEMIKKYGFILEIFDALLKSI